MKYFIILLFLLPKSFAYGDDLNERIIWFNEAQWGLSAEIETAKYEKLEELMGKLGQLWLRRDGALGSEVAPFITKIVTKEPNAVFVWFQRHPKDYSVFVEDIQYFVFTDYNGDKEEVKKLEQLRIKTISACRSFALTSESKEIGELAKSLESKLSSIVVRAID